MKVAFSSIVIFVCLLIFLPAASQNSSQMMRRKDNLGNHWKLPAWTELPFFIFSGTLFNHEIESQACKKCKYGLDSAIRAKLTLA